MTREEAIRTLKIHKALPVSLKFMNEMPSEWEMDATHMLETKGIIKAWLSYHGDPDTINIEYSESDGWDQYVGNFIAFDSELRAATFMYTLKYDIELLI